MRPAVAQNRLSTNPSLKRRKFLLELLENRLLMAADLDQRSRHGGSLEPGSPGDQHRRIQVTDRSRPYFIT